MLVKVQSLVFWVVGVCIVLFVTTFLVFTFTAPKPLPIPEQEMSVPTTQTVSTEVRLQELNSATTTSSATLLEQRRSELK